MLSSSIITAVISFWDIGAARVPVCLQNGTSMMANSVDVLHHSPPVCGLKEEFSHSQVVVLPILFGNGLGMSFCDINTDIVV